MKSRSMPSKNDIHDYWQSKFNEKYNRDIEKNCCFACGYRAARLERCHVLPRNKGGYDNLSNLHLLCRFCHLESEFFVGESYDLWITNKDESLEMQMHMNQLNHYMNLITNNLPHLVPSDILTKLKNLNNEIR